MFNKNEYLFSSRSRIKTVLNVWYICTISLYGTFFSENKISTFFMYFAGTCWFTEKKNHYVARWRFTRVPRTVATA